MRAGVNSVAGSADCSSDSAVVIVLVQADPRDGARVSARRISHRDRSRRGICVQHTARLHLVPVVIFGVDPEHRDRGNAVFGAHAFGELQGRQGFEKGEQRPAKQPGLLSCDDRDGRGIDQLRGCGTRFGWCVASLLLREQDIGNERVAVADDSMRARWHLATHRDRRGCRHRNQPAARSRTRSRMRAA